MDPLTITTGCVSLLSGLTALSKQITSFVVVARQAKPDMDAFSREIASITPCLEALRQPDLIRFYPDALRPNLVTIIRECDGVAGEMRDLLSRRSSGSVAMSLQWSLTTRGEAVRLRQSLEVHKSALQIAIGLIDLSATHSIQNDTSSIRGKASLIPAMKEDTAQIVELRREIAALRRDFNMQRPGLSFPKHRPELSLPMQRFLDESINYAESLCDSTEPEEMDSIVDVVDDKFDRGPIRINDNRWKFPDESRFPPPRRFTGVPKRYRAGGSTMPLDLASLE